MDIEEFKYAGTNITAFRLVDPDNEDVQVMWEYFHFEAEGSPQRRISSLINICFPEHSQGLEFTRAIPGKEFWRIFNSEG